MHACGQFFLQQSIKLAMTFQRHLTVEDLRHCNNLEMTFSRLASMSMAFIFHLQMERRQRCL